MEGHPKGLQAEQMRASCRGSGGQRRCPATFAQSRCPGSSKLLASGPKQRATHGTLMWGRAAALVPLEAQRSLMQDHHFGSDASAPMSMSSAPSGVVTPMRLWCKITHTHPLREFTRMHLQCEPTHPYMPPAACSLGQHPQPAGTAPAPASPPPR